MSCRFAKLVSLVSCPLPILFNVMWSNTAKRPACHFLPCWCCRVKNQTFSLVEAFLPDHHGLLCQQPTLQERGQQQMVLGHEEWKKGLSGLQEEAKSSKCEKSTFHWIIQCSSRQSQWGRVGAGVRIPSFFYTISIFLWASMSLWWFQSLFSAVQVYWDSESICSSFVLSCLWALAKSKGEQSRPGKWFQIPRCPC